MDKIKAFFNNKIVKVVSWIVMLVAAAILIIGGIGVADIDSGIKLVAGILALIGDVIVLIGGKTKKNN